MVERGLAASREKAQRAILAGRVSINRQPARKPSDAIRPSDEIAVTAPEKFVSRGGHKLEHALVHFPVEVSAGGRSTWAPPPADSPTACCSAGPARSTPWMSARANLAWKLRQDPRVVVMEKTNARSLTPARFPQPFEPVDLVVIDCSFISLKKILPPTLAFLRPMGKIVALVKPQFEAGKAEADRGSGVITDPQIHQRVLAELQQFVQQQAALAWLGATESPLLGPAGNKEFLILLEKTA